MAACQPLVVPYSRSPFPAMFGVGSVPVLRQLSTITRAKRLVDRDGRDVYLGHPERLDLPILFLQGERNSIFLPPGSARTMAWLRKHNGTGRYQRRVLPRYAHLDTIVGRDAARDVYPHILRFLDQNP